MLILKKHINSMHLPLSFLELYISIVLVDPVGHSEQKSNGLKYSPNLTLVQECNTYSSSHLFEVWFCPSATCGTRESQP